MAQNPYVESFGSRIRDELLSGELFETLAEAQVLMRTGASTTTPSGPTQRLAWWLRPGSPPAGGEPTTRSIDSHWRLI